MEKLRVLDLFSGIGGFSLGLERTGGFETVAFCEMKPHAQAVLAKNFPGVPCHDDVTTYEFKEGEADVITAGFPCQDLSFAGSGTGLAGSRSGLYREVIRAIRVVRPLRAVLENVAALLSRGLGTVLGDLAEIGYDTEWHCIPASAVGAPHRRDRIWIAAHPGGKQHGGTPLSGALSEELARAAADSYSQSVREQPERELWGSDTPLFISNGQEEPVADADPKRQLQSEGGEQDERRWTGDGSEAVAHPELVGRQEVEQSNPSREKGQGAADQIEHTSQPAGRGWWSVEPGLGRVAHGVPNRVDRLEELGNAVVPQIPEIIGCAILESLEQQRNAA